MTKLSEWLDSRGLTGIEEIAGLVEQGEGMLYPSSAKHEVRRWKAFDSEATPKYLWQPKDMPTPRYYALNGVKAAIEDKNGIAHFCFGEPDVWTMYLAGEGNAFCCFGDNNFPAETFVADLRQMGVQLLFVWADHDEAGVRLATRIIKLLAPEIDIAIDVRYSPSMRDTHYDLNRFWMDACCDRDLFRKMIDELPDFELSTEIAESPKSKELTRQIDSGNADEKNEVERFVRAEVERALVKRGGKEGVYDCPLPHGKDGKDFYYTLDGPIGGCQGKHGGEFTRWMDLALFLDVNVSQIARDVARDHRETDTQQRPSENAPDRPPTVTGRDARKRFDDWMIGRSLPSGRPLIWPYTPIHTAEGNAQVLMTKLGVLIVSISGGGKTSHIGTLVDAWRADNVHGFLWSPENGAEFHEGRAIARWGGPSVKRQRSNLMYQYDKRDGVPEVDRRGFPYTGEEIAAQAHTMEMLDAYQGDVVYPSTMLSVSDYCEEIAKLTWEARVLRGENVAYVAFDYAQRTKFNTKSIGQGWDILEHVAGEISQCAIDNDLVWILFSQAKKDLGPRVRNGSYILGADSAQGITDYLPQLMYTLNPVYKKNVDEPGTFSRIEKAKINVCKNNDGQQILTTVKTDLVHYYWPNELAYVKRDEEDEDLEDEGHWTDESY